MTEDDAASQLEPVLQPVLRWMNQHRTPSLHIKASNYGNTATLDAPRDHSQHLIHCDEQPESPGVLGVFIVVDRASGGRHDGPSEVPMDVLGPLLQQLEALNIEEIKIATGPEASPASDASGSATNKTCSFDPDEFTEYIDPAPHVPVVVAFTLAGNDG